MSEHLGSPLQLTSVDRGVEVLAAIPEERIWLAGQRSAQTRRAYAVDVRDFIQRLGIRSPDELRQVDRLAVIAWRDALEAEGAQPATVRRKLAALSSLFTHLAEHGLVRVNPCREVKRPRVSRRAGSTAAFSSDEAFRLLSAPPADTVHGLRDRAILSVGLQAGARRTAIARLRVRDFHQDRGQDCLAFVWKGGERHTLVLHENTAHRIREYLVASGHAGDRDGPLFRRVTKAGGSVASPISSQVVNRVLQRWVAAVGIPGQYSAHSMRATFITTALDKGAALEDVQAAAGHADPSTTKLYDRRRNHASRLATMYVDYGGEGSR